MSTQNMEYNSQKGHLVIPEYGRNVQNMIFQIRDMEDKEKRQRLAEAVIELMYQMNTADRSNPDYKEKLWRHLFYIADYKIDVIPPDGDIPNPETSAMRPGIIAYAPNLRKNRHYGKLVQDLIAKAVAMEEGEKRDEFTMIIASYMKMAYRTWNREHFVSDGVIKQDLEKISGGVLTMDDEETIDVIATSAPRNTNSTHHRNKGGRNNNNRNKGGRNNNRNNNNRGRRR